MDNTVHIEDLIIPRFDDLLMDVLDHKHTVYTLPGGRGSTKSSFIGIAIPLLITQYPDAHAIAYRKIAGNLRQSVYAEMAKGINRLGLSEQFRFVESRMEIVYKPTGQTIFCRGLDKPESIKSITTKSGYIAIEWWEELDQFHGREEIRTAHLSTARGGDKFWVFESFNPPITAANWANKDILIERENRIVVKSSYLDVPKEWLGPEIIEEAEFLKTSNERAYRHTFLGEPVGTGGMVFENLVSRTITDEELARFDRIYNGVDWGWVDPWAFTRSYYNANLRELWIFYEDGGSKLPNNETAKRVKSVITPDDLVVCDSAEPKSVRDYIAADIWAQGAAKGPDSVRYSMKWLQSLNAIYIDPERCPKAFEEFSEYEYERTKDGEVVEAYPDKNDHYISAVRYSTEVIWKHWQEMK